MRCPEVLRTGGSLVTIVRRDRWVVGHERVDADGGLSVGWGKTETDVNLR